MPSQIGIMNRVVRNVELSVVKRMPAGKATRLIGITLFAFSGMLAGCKPDPNLEFIQGIWYFNDPHLRDAPGESNMESTWVFHRGSFQHSACCFVKVQESGWYRLIKADDRGITLELFNLEGHVAGMQHSRQDSMEIRLVIDRGADTLKIGAAGPYRRIGR